MSLINAVTFHRGVADVVELVHEDKFDVERGEKEILMLCTQYCECVKSTLSTYRETVKNIDWLPNYIREVHGIIANAEYDLDGRFPLDDKIKAIKTMKVEGGMYLKEAKAYVENLIEEGL